MEQLSLSLPAGPAVSAAHDAAAGSPLPAYLLARLDEECRKPNPTDTRMRRLIISGCVPAYYAPASKEPQRITEALRERNLTLLDGARALRINLDQMDALERIQQTLSSREVLVVVSALDDYISTPPPMAVDSATCTCARISASATPACMHVLALRPSWAMSAAQFKALKRRITPIKSRIKRARGKDADNA